jgi:hypothetical protein
MLSSGYDHDSNERTKIIIRIRSFKYPKLEIDFVDYNNGN